MTDRTRRTPDRLTTVFKILAVDHRTWLAVCLPAHRLRDPVTARCARPSCVSGVQLSRGSRCSSAYECRDDSGLPGPFTLVARSCS